MLADIFWFFMTEYVIRRHYEKRITKSMQSDDKRFIISLVDKHFFWVLIFIKFLMGMRLVLTIYIVLKNRIPFFQKVLIDAVGTVLFLAVLFPIGWLFGKGVSSALSLEQNILTILSAVVFIILFVSLAPKIFIFVLKKIFKYKKSPLSTTV
jgi:membrane protein DedA with SNARE-associated domain